MTASHPQPQTAAHNNNRLLPMPGGAAAVPQALDAEKALIGGVLIDPASYGRASDTVKADDFFLIRHAHIWRAIGELAGETTSIDIVTLADRLEKQLAEGGQNRLQAIGGRAYLAELGNSVPTSVHVASYAQLVVDASVRRSILKACDETRAEALDESKKLEELTARYESRFGSLTTRASRGGLEQIADAVTAEIERLEEAMDNPNPARYYVPMPYPSLNHFVSGWGFGKLAYVGSYMHGGKTTILMQAAIAAALAGFTVALFSVEGTTAEVTRDIVTMRAGLRSDDVLKGNLTRAEYLNYLNVGAEVSKWDLYIDGDSEIDPRTMYARIRRLQSISGNKKLIVFVDYLGKLMLPPVPKDSRQDSKADSMLRAAAKDDRLRYQYLSGAMKTTAVDLGVAMVVAAQNGRPEKSAPVRRRKDQPLPPPQAHEIAGSAALERDADLIIMPQFIDKAAGRASMHVIKNKQNGWTGSVPMVWDKRRIFLDSGQRIASEADSFAHEHWSDK